VQNKWSRRRTPIDQLGAKVISLKLVVSKGWIFSARYLRKFLMKTARFSDAQIIGILNQAEGGTPVSELRREHGISSASFYKWWAEVPLVS